MIHADPTVITIGLFVLVAFFVGWLLVVIGRAAVAVRRACDRYVYLSEDDAVRRAARIEASEQGPRHLTGADTNGR